jgi:chromosome segregation ATPase
VIAQERLESSIKQTQQNITTAEQNIDISRQSRSEPNRPTKLQSLEQLRLEEKSLSKRLEDLKENDPEHIDSVIQESKRCKAAANRWTDNVWVLKSFLTRKMGRSSKEVNFTSFMLFNCYYITHEIYKYFYYQILQIVQYYFIFYK